MEPTACPDKPGSGAFSMWSVNRTAIGTILLLAVVTLAACARRPIVPEAPPHVAYGVEPLGGIFSAHSPIFVHDSPDESFNRIGTPTASLDADGVERVYVDPSKPTIYVHKLAFKTGRGVYTNLYYRVHFERVPFNLLPFNVSAGMNTGLIVVVTLNNTGDPLLYTTVHTCGCYLAIVPTSNLPDDAYPPNWDREGQRVYGEKLPGLLDFSSGEAGGYRAVVRLRSKSHRVRAVSLANALEIKEAFRLENVPILPFDALEALTMGDGSVTSFFETEGLKKGYVKGSGKPFEKLFISWWAFDWRVGQDKIFNPEDSTNTIFYTSLKFWRREASDMEDFPKFLRYWGWSL